MRLLAVAIAVAVLMQLCACGGEVPTSGDHAGSLAGVEVELDEPPVTRLVILGDSIGRAVGVGQGLEFHSLLVKNDDQRYPELAGRDLTSLFAGVDKRVLGRPGARSPDVVQQAHSVPSNRSGRTMVIVSVGLNDFRSDMLSVLDADKVREKAQALIDNLARVHAHFADSKRYPDGVVLGLFNIYDPTDQAGQPPSGLHYGYLFHCSCYAAFSHSGNLALFNGLLAKFAERSGWMLLDLHRRFSGHGYQHQNPASPFHQVQDPSLWFQLDCLHANERGNHEIRQLIWQQMVGG